MNITAQLMFLASGTVTGWLAGVIMKGGGFGLLGDIVVGIVGAVIGGTLFGVLGVSAGGSMLGSILTATSGAVVLLFLIKPIKQVQLPVVSRRSGRIAQWAAATFFSVWMVIAVAAADYPPPPGFIVLIIMLLGCAALVYFRVLVYLQWNRSRLRGRVLRVIRDGAVGGAAVALPLILLSPGEPSIPPGLSSRLIGFGALLALGIGNALAAVLSARRCNDGEPIP